MNPPTEKKHPSYLVTPVTDAEKAFDELCKRHDWYYSFSDDHGVWQRGERQSADLCAALKADPTLQPIYDSWLKTIFSKERGF